MKEKKLLRCLIVSLLLLLMPISVKAASLGTPVLKKASSVSYNSIRITWGKVAKATSYVVYRKTSGKNFKKIAAVSGTSYTNKNVKCGTTYIYTVKAYNKSNNTYSGYNKAGIKGKAIPSKPQGLMASVSKNIVTLRWKKVSGASGYTVYRAKAGDDSFYQIGTTNDASSLTYYDGNLNNGTYRYKVRAYRNSSDKKIYGRYSGVCTCTVSVPVEMTDSFEEFGAAAADLIIHSDIPDNPAAAEADEFYSCRLIVKAKVSGMNFASCSPLQVLAGPENYYVLSFKNSADTKRAYTLLSSDSRIEYVEPDSYVEASDEISDNQADSYSWGVSAIGADALAAYVKKQTNSSITVAVVDSGVGNHTFINNRVKGGFDYVDGDKNPVDLRGHGTHVAGTIVDCTPGLKVYILPVRVLDAEGNGSTLNVGNGIRYAASHGAKVINISLGGPHHSQYKDDAINAAIKSGVTVVASAGNLGINTSGYCPAHMKNVIVVSALDEKKINAGFSNFGNSVDLAAPGVSIYSTLPGNRMGFMSGTSMAAPHISAAAAMILLLNPSYKPSAVESKLKNICTDLGPAGFDKYYGYGIPDLKKLIKSEPVEIKPTDISLSASQITLNIGQTYTLTAKVLPDNAANKKVTWSSSNTSVAAVSNGTITGKAEGTATVTAKTHNGKQAGCTVKVVRPTIEATGISLNTSSVTINIGQSYTLTATVLPGNATNKTVTWSSSNTSVADVSNGTISGKAEGTATVTAKTHNGKTAECQVKVIDNRPDTVKISLVKARQYPLEMGIGEILELKAEVSGGRSVEWTSSNQNVATVSSTGQVRGISSGNVTISAQTARGGKDSITITVKKAYIAVDNLYYTAQMGERLDIKGKIYLDRNIESDTSNYILYYAFLNRGWDELASFKIDGPSPFAPTWKGDAYITSLHYSQNIAEFTISVDTSRIGICDNRMFAVSIFPINSFSTGNSINDTFVMVTIK